MQYMQEVAFETKSYRKGNFKRHCLSLLGSIYQRNIDSFWVQIGFLVIQVMAGLAGKWFRGCGERVVGKEIGNSPSFILEALAPSLEKCLPIVTPNLLP